ncbi:riboflavin synthase [Paenarthrobacter ureafaciens]|jgi:riboflavin synthase|uniref:Riboflavin synthase n=2 Tax=Paenarthrobacter ureafaciens TaxID=37931 RepID=A0AAX3ENE2_PAEUR|nr:MULTISPECIES: riboflavin synthase [Paenarthrobacter]AMB40160.1 riboflavin synthase subunit alpha [Arthrobacter sp. ATCC 21022]NKR12949.1 riboflavin synthase subunit alpha [Arthrobacter sp. M5]NKR15409.1 riboflavin synthase subunit alpha [Arthrobacter sp. M6]OEH59514.1 riboflavin synthase subunit alpha [Arthrobacter sp. D2]OEH60603.1 riboflavin synthase subunit alpha [Arthrobacter sp. D4]BCW83934.1 riboflavin synthase subunit alpha [Arthrobacter sp. NicSoilE8]
MFTGIVAEQGTVLGIDHDGEASATLRLKAPTTTEGLALGGSIAVNGVCLTATQINGQEFSVDVMGETLLRTTIGQLAAGDSVNLERCVPAGGRLDGHVVQGHVDGVGELLEREALGNWDRLRFGVPATLARYIAEKGSIAVDGVSLTVTAVSPAADPEPWFEVGLIPTTLEETGLGAKPVGAKVNLEVDVLAKYTERLLSFAPQGKPAHRADDESRSASPEQTTEAQEAVR